MALFRPLLLRHGLASKSLQVIVSFLFFCILLSLLGLQGQQPSPPSIYDYTDGKTPGAFLGDGTANEPQSVEAAYLRSLVSEYGLTREVPWFARRIRTKEKSNMRKSMTQMSVDFMSRDFQRVDTGDEPLNLRAEKAIKLPVSKSARPHQTDAASLIFGVSTSYNRITYANVSLVNDWARWLTDGRGRSNGASLVLTLQLASNAEVSYVSTRLREAGIDAVVLSTEENLDITTRYVKLLRLLTRRSEELAREGKGKKYMALVDDDVFFPSLGKLLGRLEKFDAKKKVYIGMPSERTDWTVEKNTTMTYGGGAVFFSKPMADSLMQLPCLKGNVADESYGTGQWDELLYRCVSKHTDENLWVFPSLYIPDDDFHGLRTGYESGVQPLTLHHYKHRHRFEPSKAHLVASLCGENCFLQRFWFRDGWILVNGHTISHYPDGVDVLPLRKSTLLMTQQTRDERDIQRAERLVIDDAVKGRTDREVVSWTGVKRTWRLLDARIATNGEVWQAYVKRKGSPTSYIYGDEDAEDTVHTQDGPADRDSVIVLIWEP